MLSLKKIGDFAKKNPLLIILGIVLLLCIFTPVGDKITDTFTEGRRNRRKERKRRRKERRPVRVNNDELRDLQRVDNIGMRVGRQGRNAGRNAYNRGRSRF